METKDVFSGIIEAIPANLQQRMLKEIQHALTTNLCSYGEHYVSHVVFHFTSAELPHLPQVFAEIGNRLAQSSWFFTVEKSDPHFLEVFIANSESLVSPLDKSAFKEASGNDFPDDDFPEFDDGPISMNRAMEKLDAIERVLQAIDSLGLDGVAAKVVRTSVKGPHLAIDIKGNGFRIFPTDPDTKWFTVNGDKTEDFSVFGAAGLIEVVNSLAGKGTQLSDCFVLLQERLRLHQLEYHGAGDKATIYIERNGELRCTVEAGASTDLFSVNMTDAKDIMIAEVEDIISLLS